MALFRRNTSSDSKAGQKAEHAERRTAPRAELTERPVIGELTMADYMTGVPRIRVLDFVHSLKRQLLWMVPLFALGTAAAWYMTKDFKRTYSGDGRILVQIGPEYVYDPVSGQSAAGLLITPDHIVQNEVGVIRSNEVLSRVIGEMTTDLGASVFAPDAYDKINSTREGTLARREAVYELRREVEDNFVVMPQAKSSIVDLVYRHENPDVAVATLNAFIDAYIAERKELFVEGSADIVSERRMAAEAQLRENERQLSRFLTRNDISDFDSERVGVTQRTETLRAELNGLRGSLSESEAALATVETQLRSTNREINLYVDDRASQRVAQAELELKQLLAKYLPSSEPVRRKQTEIAELRALQNAQGGRASGGRRVGPNPVFQELQTRRNTLAAQADSLREKEFIVQQQLNSADAKTKRLRNLSPEYANLLRERETLSARLRSLNTKEQEALVNQQQAEAATENVRVISRADLPRKGRNARLLAFALATLAWGGLLFMFALMRVFMDPRLYGRQGPAAGYAPTQPTNSGPNWDAPDHTIPEPVVPFTPSDAPDAPPFSEPAPAYAHDPYAHEQAEPLPAVSAVAEPALATDWDAPAWPEPSVAPTAAPVVMETVEEAPITETHAPAAEVEPVVDDEYDMDGYIAKPWTPSAYTGPVMAEMPSEVAAPPVPVAPIAPAAPQDVPQNVPSNPYMTGEVSDAFGRG